MGFYYKTEFKPGSDSIQQSTQKTDQTEYQKQRDLSMTNCTLMYHKHKMKENEMFKKLHGQQEIKMFMPKKQNPEE